MKKSPRSFMAKRISDDSFCDEYNILWKESENYGYAPIKFPLAGSVIEDLDKLTWLDPYDPERVKGLRKEIKELDENTDYAIVADVMCRDPFELVIKLRGYEQFLTNFYTNKKFNLAL